MNIYIAGISGTAMGPLALMAKEAGMQVCGSDLVMGAVTGELESQGIAMSFGPQDGKFLKQKMETEGVDWYVYTSALFEDNPELLLAKKSGLRVSKRDELIAYLIEQLDLKMVGVAGTHGKTTTTSMIIWGCLELGLPISYLVGTTLPFAESGKYDKDSEFLIYEADEYDKNFLRYSPWLAVITTVSYDHADIYPTLASYRKAFLKFVGQSEQVISNDKLVIKKTDTEYNITPEMFNLSGKVRREDACLAAQAILKIVAEIDLAALGITEKITVEKIIDILNQFPGSGRRFEKLADGIYSDYAHHPEEIVATIDLAREEARKLEKAGVVIIYEPHNNGRQHEVKSQYRRAFIGASEIFWLPTYLARNDEKKEIIKPEDFIAELENARVAHPAEMGPELLQKIRELKEKNYLILLLTAGPADAWLRSFTWEEE